MSDAYRDKVMNNMWLVDAIFPSSCYVASIKGDVIASEVDKRYAEHIVELHNAWLTKQREEENMADQLKGIPFSSADEGIDFPLQAKQCVLRNYNEMGIGTPRGEAIDYLKLSEVYVVWFSFVRGNWKAMLSTSRPDGRIYEVSYKRENDGSDGPESLIVDTYLKTHNTVM